MGGGRVAVEGSLGRVHPTVEGSVGGARLTVERSIGGGRLTVEGSLGGAHRRAEGNQRSLGGAGVVQDCGSQGEVLSSLLPGTFVI